MLIALLSLVFIHFCALITPGPDFFLISQTSISRPRKDALYAVLGVTAGVVVWASIALLGLNIIFEKFVWLKRAIFILGGLYLCYLGYLMLRSAFRKKNNNAPELIKLPQSGYLLFLKGLLTNLSNPKAVVYFGSIFSVFLNNPALEHLHSVLFIIVCVETFLWFLLVACIFSLPSFKTLYERGEKWIDGVSGGLFTLIGVYLIGQK